MKTVPSEETKLFNVLYHSDYDKALKKLEEKNGKLRKKLLVQQVIEHYYNAYKEGAVTPQRTTLRREESTIKPRFCAYLELRYHAMFDEIFLSVKESDDYKKLREARYTKTKLLEEMLAYWLESEGKTYE